MTASPDARPPLDRDRLAGLGPDLVVQVLEETTSTNGALAEWGRAGSPEGLVLVAEHQSAGRGRLDRTWEAPPRSSLVFSLLLRPTVPPAQWPWLSLLTGYTVAKVLRGQGYDAGVKWPNDVLIRDRKVAGILLERVEGPTGTAAVLGIGLNVDQTRAELPVPTATSLALESGSAPDRTTPDRTGLLMSLLRSLQEAYDAWQAGGEAATGRLRSSYTAACVTVGREVRVEMPSGPPLTGRATGVDEVGRLLVAGPEGQTAVGAGDVVHVRPADR